MTLPPRLYLTMTGKKGRGASPIEWNHLNQGGEGQPFKRQGAKTVGILARAYEPTEPKPATFVNRNPSWVGQL